MTAEIAVMNKNGIALAADSAVTISGIMGQKIYSTHKLFMLSKYFPVGVMVFGNAELLGVPWQVIIKEFRKKELDATSYPTLQEYGNRLISYLNENIHRYFPPEIQKEFFAEVVSNIFEKIDEKITNNVKEITRKRKISEKEASLIIENQVQTPYQILLRLENLETLPNNGYKLLFKLYKSDIEEMIKHYFPFLKPEDSLAKLLRRIAVLSFTKNTFNIFEEEGIDFLAILRNYSGIVIAGFGENEIYPSIIEYDIQTVIDNHLKYFVRQEMQVKQNNPAVVMPFAQQEMVYSFMEGISPTYQDTIEEYLKVLFASYPKEIIKQIGGLDAKSKNELLKKMNNATIGLVEQFITELGKWSKINNVYPILGTVAFLPLEELASMAESLVNLTSFKRRVTMESETVGGAIDVAVISKGDGFIWINRKHYFDPKYNPHFSANYYRE